MITRSEVCHVLLETHGPAPTSDRPGDQWDLAKEILGVRIPDSPLVRGAVMLAHSESPRFLFNHSMRTFVFGALAAQRMNWNYDEELVVRFDDSPWAE